MTWKCRGIWFGLLFGLSSVAGTPVSATSLLALVDTGELYASNDQGTSWGIRSTLPVSDASALIAGTSPSELYLASSTGTVYRSNDAGTIWTAVGSIGASDVVAMTGRPDGGLVAMTRTGTVYESADLGATWSGKGTLTASNMASLILAANGNLYALTETGEVSESLDDGATWTTVGAAPVSDAVDIGQWNANLVMLTGTGVLYLSVDNGVNWSAVGTASQVGMIGLAPLAANLIAVSREGMVVRSANGSAWNWVGSVNQLHVRALATDYPTAVGVPDSPTLPVRLTLAPPRPNPLTQAGTPLQIQFDLPGPDRVEFALYDLAGRRVSWRPPESIADSGVHTVRWPLSGLSSGVYFLLVTTSQGHRATSRVTLVH